MKNVRQEKILELIRKYNFDTQEALQKKLLEDGFNVTQATVSRDIRELGIIKSEGDDKVYKYRVSPDREKGGADNLVLILRQSTTKVDVAKNLVILKTFAGMGSAAGAALDAMELEEIMATLAGDDTVLIVTKDDSIAEELCVKFKSFLGN